MGHANLMSVTFASIVRFLTPFGMTIVLAAGEDSALIRDCYSVPVRKISMNCSGVSALRRRFRTMSSFNKRANAPTQTR